MLERLKINVVAITWLSFLELSQDFSQDRYLFRYDYKRIPPYFRKGAYFSRFKNLLNLAVRNNLKQTFQIFDETFNSFRIPRVNFVNPLLNQQNTGSCRGVV